MIYKIRQKNRIFVAFLYVNETRISKNHIYGDFCNAVVWTWHCKRFRASY